MIALAGLAFDVNRRIQLTNEKRDYLNVSRKSRISWKKTFGFDLLLGSFFACFLRTTETQALTHAMLSIFFSKLFQLFNSSFNGPWVFAVRRSIGTPHDPF